MSYRPTVAESLLASVESSAMSLDEVDALLRPYEDLPADALGELPSGLDDDDARSAYTTSPPSSQVEVSSQ